MRRYDLTASLTRYLANYPDDELALLPMLERLRAGFDVTARDSFSGHITASGWIVDMEAQRLFLIFHKALNRWLPPGGHLEAKEHPLEAARRELEEEVGQGGLTLHHWHEENGHAPMEIESHPIPENPLKGEPEHRHFDFRYVFLADRSMIPTINREEIDRGKWFRIPRIRKMFPEIFVRLGI